jgi:hypothetical protein
MNKRAEQIKSIFLKEIKRQDDLASFHSARVAKLTAEMKSVMPRVLSYNNRTVSAQKQLDEMPLIEQYLSALTEWKKASTAASTMRELYADLSSALSVVDMKNAKQMIARAKEHAAQETRSLKLASTVAKEAMKRLKMAAQIGKLSQVDLEHAKKSAEAHGSSYGRAHAYRELLDSVIE